MDDATSSDSTIDFLETTANCSLFHRISAYMTAELRQGGHDQPEGSLTADDLQHAHAIFACRELSVVGMIVVSFHADAELARLYRLWIAPSARRSGMGRALMMHAERFVAGKGGRVIEFDTGHDLVPAVALYRSLDYKEKPFLERSPRSLLFRKSLAAAEFESGRPTNTS
ncbi:GNAT family N-acetyltransferase [Dyella kyungheensis]|uniref:GNAT family N-acetyltransferase n=1 Tax=Dyella kyungheensis TaxID=1242174 RepID=A0ABS2JTH2_9GAMM|nr:GNAT family N-acetyltransferase [Dyella kyungheensis]MBM7122176.1 GNAT family N-acetyltransferase [Dyella kyungheensis]